VIRHDDTFPCMGTEVRVLIEDPVEDPSAAGAWARRSLESAARRLTRFDPASELSRLNASPEPTVEASPLLRSAVAAALWAAETTGGLVDPTVLPDLARAGYDKSRTGVAPASLADALAAAPPPAPAAAHPAEHWRAITLTDTAIARPPGIAVDTGGTTKGMLADAVAQRLARFARFVVDCGGDMRVGGRDAVAVDVRVEHPLTRDRDDSIRVVDGGVATSTIANRVWRRPNGDGFAHHLIDPATGEPAWTGLLGVTAVATTALEAETVAKAALLGGPDAARERLSTTGGGRLFHADGRSERVDATVEHYAVAA
jgi:thiamine biosynthesis lipoprotein